MSTVLEADPLMRIVERASKAQRLYMIERLLPLVLAENATRPIHLENSKGEPIGVFYPYYRSTKKSPPPMTPEFEAELNRRAQTPEDSVDLKAFIRLVEQELARQSK